MSLRAQWRRFWCSHVWRGDLDTLRPNPDAAAIAAGTSLAYLVDDHCGKCGARVPCVSDRGPAEWAEVRARQVSGETRRGES